MEDPDPDVLAAAAEGDRRAVADLVEFVQPHVWRFVSSLERNRATAEDLAQEALLRMVRGLSDFRGSGSFRSWVFAITRNVVRDHQRAVSRRPRLVSQPIGGEGPAAGESSVSARDVGLVVDLQRAIDRLSPELQEVFVLVEVHGLRYREVAEILDLAEGTVKSRMFHARRALIRDLEVSERARS